MIAYTFSKLCPNCKTEFDAKRRNKKFCSSKCKSFFNNNISFDKYHERKKYEDDITRPTNIQLFKNREILKNFMDTDVDENSLLKLGFSFDCCTGFSQNQKYGKMVFHCYDTFYLCIAKNQIRIRSNQSNF